MNEAARGGSGAPPVTTRVDASGTALIELTRPGALNALDLAMVRAMTDALRDWREDDRVRSVVVRSTSPKAFCAGGDIRAVRTAGLNGDDGAVAEYFGAEYALDAMIARYPKPYTALVDGYAMGGGLGISVHGSARVVTERAVLAMPETAIGFFPDIGASWFLPRLPYAVGWYLGLTGVRLSGAAAVACGLATHYLPAAELPALEQELISSGEEPGTVLDRYAVPAPGSELDGHRESIAHCFRAPDLDAIRERLAGLDTGREWADETLALLEGASPMSLGITFDLLRAGADPGTTLEDCLAREFGLACRTAREPDFHEGVRAALVDRDRKPRWATRP